MKFVLAIDSFKGCMTSDGVEKAVAQTIHRLYPQAEIVRIPVSDGGDGMLDAFLSATDGRRVMADVHGPLGDIVKAEYGIAADGETAIVEMAKASGLMLLPRRRLNPMQASTYGTGELIADAISRGCRRFVVGLGGSTTNDAGTGMLQALGYRFLDADGHVLPRGGEILSRICSIDDTAVNPQLKECFFTIAADVVSPLYGDKGAAYVYARQKGADDAMIAELDAGLRHFSDIVLRLYHRHIEDEPGAGAAGGLGAALLAFTDARIFSGADLLLDMVQFDKIVDDANLVITGEGKADRQTLAGKLPMVILRRCKSVPVILMAGQVEDRDALLRFGYREAVSITPPNIPLAVAMIPSVARRNIDQALLSIRLDYR